MQFSLLGIKIDNFSREKIHKKIKSFLDENKFHQIATVNPEFILQAQQNESFKSILNGCDLNIADGIGIRFAFWRFGKNLKCRWSGIDLMWEILKEADKRKLKVFLATNNDGLSNWNEVSEIIKKKLPKLQIFGKNISKNSITLNTEILSKCHILLCNFGAPWQEKFVAKLKKQQTNIKLAIGVGGAFDFISGKIKRAPKWLRVLGLEWLWRLIQQPNRIKRILNAVVIFPIRIIFNR